MDRIRGWRKLNATAVASTSVAQGATSTVLVINIEELLALSGARRDHRGPSLILLSLYR